MMSVFTGVQQVNETKKNITLLILNEINKNSPVTVLVIGGATRIDRRRCVTSDHSHDGSRSQEAAQDQICR